MGCAVHVRRGHVEMQHGREHRQRVRAAVATSVAVAAVAAATATAAAAATAVAHPAISRTVPSVATSLARATAACAATKYDDAVAAALLLQVVSVADQPAGWQSARVVRYAWRRTSKQPFALRGSVCDVFGGGGGVGCTVHVRRGHVEVQQTQAC